MFTVSMLAEMTGSNRQYLSRKIKKMVEDPQIGLCATIRSNKEGYRISEKEVLRCFDNISPQQIQAYKKQQMGEFTGVHMLTQEPQTQQRPLMEENDLLIEWRIQIAAAAPNKKYSSEMYAYLEDQLVRIQKLKDEKLKELARLEHLVENAERTISDIQLRLKDWPKE